MKDLAALDLWAAKLCPTTERLRFLKNYLGLQKLDIGAKAMARDIIQFRRKRWPRKDPWPDSDGFSPATGAC